MSITRILSGHYRETTTQVALGLPYPPRSEARGVARGTQVVFVLSGAVPGQVMRSPPKTTRAGKGGAIEAAGGSHEEAPDSCGAYSGR